MSTPRIKPATLKGFRDHLPGPMLAREGLIDTARSVYRSYGFSPIDTPALEYSEILLGKGGQESDKQLFRFTDQGNRDVAMRFDLTVPLARYAAQHLQEIGTPFKRYHIATVWRAEKPQKGRFREFMQCDFDTIGTTSNTADIETLFVIHDLMERLGFTDFTIRVNNRKLLNGLLETLALEDSTAEILRCLDKLGKIGRDRVAVEMQRVAGVTAAQAEGVLSLADCQGTSSEILDNLQPRISASEAGVEGIERLRELFQACARAGIPDNRVTLDPTIARGLDYYTGTIYETFLDALPGIGSVCSGGRYDDLAELFTSQALPGVGASLGLDRLLAAMQELHLTPAGTSTAAVLVTFFDANHSLDYLAIARRLRAEGIACEVFPDARPLGKQLKYADRKGFRLAVIAGADEFGENAWQIKDLREGEQHRVSDDNLAPTILDILD
ncbi:MAG: histidine--tRNA ligase [Planctomycetaceae bacterium]|nr:histidine--tRNA ligase [Planctomycetaceae bacterium]